MLIFQYNCLEVTVMNQNYIDAFVDRLRRWDYILELGLSDQEVSSIEARFGFCFPPDLRCFLQQVMPASGVWVNWRTETDAAIMERLNWPLEGIIFDVKQQAFWLDSWGKKPEDQAEAIELARREIAKAPTLIPIYSHRYIPSTPSLAGNPVFSVHQSDVIYYGYDLASYFEHEFFEGADGYHMSGSYQLDAFRKQPRAIQFWDETLQ